MVLGIWLLLNIVLAIVYLKQHDSRVGFLYLAVVISILALLYSISSSMHGKMVNG
jgi:hypothetical protein